jgi:hypothetical protein
MLRRSSRFFVSALLVFAVVCGKFAQRLATEDHTVTVADLDLLITRLAAREPVAYDLGTPMLDRGAKDFVDLVSRGAAIVPELAHRLQIASAREAVWIVAALGEIGGADAAGALRDARDRWQRVEYPDPWVYAVRGQCDIALAKVT